MSVYRTTDGEYESLNMPLHPFLRTIREVMRGVLEKDIGDEALMGTLLEYFSYLGVNLTTFDEIDRLLRTSGHEVVEYLHSGALFRELDLLIYIHYPRDGDVFLRSLSELDRFLPFDKGVGKYTLELVADTLKVTRYSYEYIYNKAFRT